MLPKNLLHEPTVSFTGEIFLMLYWLDKKVILKKVLKSQQSIKTIYSAKNHPKCFLYKCSHSTLFQNLKILKIYQQSSI